MTSYSLARELYASVGVDTEAALQCMKNVPVSLQCWQADDVSGLEDSGGDLSGTGLAATGNYPGKPRNGSELREDLERALENIPGPLRLNLHASYAERGGSSVDRDAYTVDFYAHWLDWARMRGVGMDFNPSCFAHPMAASGQTLSHADARTRKFWIDHAVACRRIGEAFGRALGTRCTVNIWIPDGSKDLPADRRGPRERLAAALDEVFAGELDPAFVEDAVECKLFGIGSESYVVGSHEFYLGYAISRQKVLCLDSGHFHPTETLADKISSVLMYVPAVLLHLSRGVRWDSDHVVILEDPTRGVAEEVVRGGYLDRVRLGLDFFDASINRVAALVIGARAAKQAILSALLQPHDTLKSLEASGDLTGRLALMEQMKTLPMGLVWSEFCERSGTAPEGRWLESVRRYEQEVFPARA